jgi:hypothetical protein
MSNSVFDRRDPKVVEAILEWALPNTNERLAFINLLANAVTFAHSFSPTAWSVTLHKQGSAALVLNIGPCEVLVLYPDSVRLVLDKVPEGFGNQEIEVWPCPYTSVEGDKWHVLIPSYLFPKLLEQTYILHMAFIQRAAMTRRGELRQGSSFSKSFSSAVPKYLSQVLAVPLCLPSWYSDELEAENSLVELESDSLEVENVGASFGLAENNRLVEEKAVSTAKNQLEQQGWQVESVERLNVGYDLLCKRGAEELHVEVKGISGTVVSFIITPNELRTSKSDRCFRLYAITKTLTEQPGITIFSGTDIENKFRLEPTGFRAVLREDF